MGSRSPIGEYRRAPESAVGTPEQLVGRTGSIRVERHRRPARAPHRHPPRV